MENTHPFLNLMESKIFLGHVILMLCFCFVRRCRPPCLVFCRVQKARKDCKARKEKKGTR